jgi:hypothetical protein
MQSATESGENRQIECDATVVTEELVKFEKLPVEVPDFRKFINHYRGISDIHLKEMKKLPTCDQLDLEKSESFRLCPNRVVS